ncbi:molybdenum cofactor guanylyltransferase [Tissierella sp. MB52-C2]|uniref:molybdenum cofactor guanylyltransferase n=1 Tax=Tissierella sp. MB52-C2 TaxID=3070999 RepID=UPI00280B5E7C|nr:molybdenum cofactor guanylyltransferase [Tissierella sp. MB52-C2]WMM25014.1 molybdenum cofactor guanylyltransferase [Tissierella sp. MB52-C2]
MKKFGTAIILAGGKSSRMGFDKQFLKIDERRLMESLVHKLNREFEEIIIVTNKPEYYIGFSNRITKDIIESEGPLSGIHAGLNFSSSEYAYVVACDMPNINMDYVRFMKTSIETKNIDGCVTRFGNWIEPFSSFYSRDIIKDIEEHLLSNRRSINSLLDKLNILYIEESKAREFSPNWDMFINLNTKEDLNSYLSGLANS